MVGVDARQRWQTDLARGLIVVDTDHRDFIRYGYAGTAACLEELWPALVAAHEHAYRLRESSHPPSQLIFRPLPRTLAGRIAWQLVDRQVALYRCHGSAKPNVALGRPVF